MNKKKLSTVLKEKKFYLSLFVGVLAVGAIFYFSMTPSTENKNNLADLNQPIVEENTNTNFTENDTSVNYNTEPDPILEQQVQETKPLETITPQQEDVQEASIKKKKDKETKVAKKENKETKTADTTKIAEEEKTVPVMQSDTKALDNLKFNQESGLLWPVNGDVILNYNAEGVVYFPTLAQYKSNPAIVISSKVGTKVVSSAKCKVTDVSENEETGVTVTTSIGDDYHIVYGQLKDVKAKVGDILEEGDVLGYIAEPTKYYVVEGSNLYYKVMEGDTSVNPLLLLR